MGAGFAERSPTPTAAAFSVAGEAPTESAMFDYPHGLGVLLYPPQAKGVLAELARSWLLFRHWLLLAGLALALWAASVRLSLQGSSD